MNKFMPILILLLAGIIAPLAQADDKSVLEAALVKMQNPKDSSDLYDAISDFSYHDNSTLNSDQKKKAYDLMFAALDGTNPIPAGRLSVSDIHSSTLRTIDRIVYDAHKNGKPSPIPNVADRLIAAANKSPDIAGDAFATVLQESRADKAGIAQSQSYQALLKVATSNSNPDLRARALRNLAGFHEGGDANEQFVLSRMSADSSPKAKAAILAGLSDIWLIDGVADPEQKGVQRLLKDSKVQDLMLSGFDLSKKYDGKGDANHPILCATIGSFESIADVAVGVRHDTINNKNLVQPSATLLQAAITKLETNYPKPTKINCPSHDLFGQARVATYDTAQMDDAMKKVLDGLKHSSGMGSVWTMYCKEFVSADKGGSSCESAVRAAVTASNVGCTDLKLKCSSPPDAYCQGQSGNCSMARGTCPAEQLRTVKGKIQVCISAKGAETSTGDGAKTSN